MQEACKFNVGDIVLATAGRDKKRLFVVISVIDELYVHIADGKLRRADAPKKKKIKHIKSVKKADPEFLGSVLKNGKYTNAALRKIIDEYRKTADSESGENPE